MTTRPSAADIRGETAAGQAAYNQRRQWLRDQGIAVIPDLYGADADDIYHLDPEADKADDARAFVAELGALEAADSAAQEERKSDDLGDLAWMWKGSDVELQR